MAKTADEAFGDLILTAAGVVNDNSYLFIGEYAERDLPTRIIAYNAVTDNWTWIEFENKHWASGVIVGGLSPDGKRQAVIANHLNQVFVVNFEHGQSWFEDEFTYDVAAGIAQVRYIGKSFYICGRRKSFLRRKGVSNWESLSFDGDSKIEFSGFDGFSERDIYLGDREEGRLFHWNGNRLNELKHDFPRGPWGPLHITALCCNEDTVYVGGFRGELLAGRKDRGWEVMVPQHETNIGDITELAWFQGTLYAMTTAALWYYDPDRPGWRLGVFPDDQAPANFGYMSVKGNRLLVAGPFGASVFDGETWTKLYGGVSGMDALRMHIMENQMDALETLNEGLRDALDESAGD